MAINTYTPEKFREELNSKMYSYIYNLTTSLSADKQNRITIIKGKLVKFAKTEEEKAMLLRWRKGEEEKLKDIPMTVGQKWSTVSKAFTMKGLSLEEKEAIFE